MPEPDMLAMNSAEKLAREIARVAVLREHYSLCGQAGGQGIIFRPQIKMIDLALDQAFEAAGSNDAEAVLAALEQLAAWQQ